MTDIIGKRIELEDPNSLVFKTTDIHQFQVPVESNEFEHRNEISTKIDHSSVKWDPIKRKEVLILRKNTLSNNNKVWVILILKFLFTNMFELE